MQHGPTGVASAGIKQGALLLVGEYLPLAKSSPPGPAELRYCALGTPNLNLGLAWPLAAGEGDRWATGDCSGVLGPLELMCLAAPKRGSMAGRGRQVGSSSFFPASCTGGTISQKQVES